MKFVKKIGFINIFFDEHKKIWFHEWLDGNEAISEKELKNTITEELDLLKIYSPTFFVSDDSNRKCVFTIDIQNWIASVGNEACISIGLKAFAVILPSELIALLSTEQAIDEAGKTPYELKIFDDKKKALEWIRAIDKFNI
jgi:hypothetical protein